MEVTSKRAKTTVEEIQAFLQCQHKEGMDMKNLSQYQSRQRRNKAKMMSMLPTVQDFEPSVETVREEDCDTILLYLPGFKKEQLRVQLTRSRNLIISGERKLEQQNVLSRFRQEFPVSTNVEANKITAKFEGSILFIRQPKLITPAGNQQITPKPPVEPAMPQKPVDEPKPETKAQEQAATSVANPLEQLNERIKRETSAKKAFPDEEINQQLNSKDSKNAPEEAANKKSVSPTKGEKSEITDEDGNLARNASEKRGSDSVNNATKINGEDEDGGKKTLDNYRQSVGGLATKLKKSRKVMNFLVVVLMALVLGIYVTNSIKSWKTEEIPEFLSEL